MRDAPGNPAEGLRAQRVAADIDPLQTGRGEIEVPEPVRSQALGCIDRMLAFVAANPQAIAQPQRGGFVRDVGPA